MARRRARNQGCSGETPGGHRFPICAARPPPAPFTAADPGRACSPRPGRDPGGRGAGDAGVRGGGRPRRLTFLRRLHGAAGGRCGPQSFSAPADCSRRAEWKLGRDWKTGTWHPRGGGGGGEQEEREQEREERALSAAAPARSPGKADLFPSGRAPARLSAARPGEMSLRGVCARGGPGCGPGTRAWWRGGGVAGARRCAPAPRCPRPAAGSGAVTVPASSESSKSRSDAGPRSASCLFKAGKHLPRLPAGRAAPAPPPCRDITPPPEPAQGPEDKSPSSCPPRAGPLLARPAGHTGGGQGRTVPAGAHQRRQGRTGGNQGGTRRAGAHGGRRGRTRRVGAHGVRLRRTRRKNRPGRRGPARVLRESHSALMRGRREQETRGARESPAC